MNQSNNNRPDFDSSQRAHQQPRRDLGFVTGERGEGEFIKANRHSSAVKWLKLILPVVAILIIGSITMSFITRQNTLPALDLESISLDDGKLVMENPKLNGVDENKRPYALTAERAIQDTANPSVVELQNIEAVLPMEKDVSADISATNGIYDADAKTLLLREAITVKTSDGMQIDLLDADVDIGNGVLKSSSPITATSPQADISSSSLYVNEGGGQLVFEGNVKMTLRPKELKR